MFVYKNAKTGKEIRVPSRMGGKWVLVEEPMVADPVKEPEPAEEKPKPKKKRTAKKGE